MRYAGFLSHGSRLRLILVVEMLLMHQHHVVVRHVNFGQPRVICSRQIDTPEGQTESDGNRRYQHIVRTRYAPSLTEYPVTERLETLDGRGIVNAEFNVGIAG